MLVGWADHGSQLSADTKLPYIPSVAHDFWRLSSALTLSTTLVFASGPFSMNRIRECAYAGELEASIRVVGGDSGPTSTILERRYPYS